MMTITIAVTFDPTTDEAPMDALERWAKTRSDREIRTLAAKRTWSEQERAHDVLAELPVDATAAPSPPRQPTRVTHIL
jgi:hypothetical protein